MQMKKVLNWMERKSIPKNHILCGDFNSLDGYYSSKVSVSKKRAAMMLEKPSFRLYTFLIEFGYVDLENSTTARITCQHSTRVDYMFASKILFQCLRETRLEVVPSGSDHKALKLILKFDSK